MVYLGLSRSLGRRVGLVLGVGLGMEGLYGYDLCGYDLHGRIEEARRLTGYCSASSILLLGFRLSKVVRFCSGDSGDSGGS